MKRRNRTKFFLGIPNERWAQEIPGLVVPLDGTDFHVIVMRTHNDGFKVFTTDHDFDCEDVLMAAAVTKDFITNYHAR